MIKVNPTIIHYYLLTIYSRGYITTSSGGMAYNLSRVCDVFHRLIRELRNGFGGGKYGVKYAG
jgi:hypothetical protein